jgi:pectate lyase-like protein
MPARDLIYGTEEKETFNANEFVGRESRSVRHITDRILDQGRNNTEATGQLYLKAAAPPAPKILRSIFRTSSMAAFTWEVVKDNKVYGYNIYSSDSDNPDTSERVDIVPQAPPFSNTSYLTWRDPQPNRNPRYYWVCSVNRVGQESVKVSTQTLLTGSPVFTGLWYNVLDFGAKGDGVTDDTTSIQKAIDTAAGAPVIFPPGTYVVTSTLTRNTSGDSQGLIIIGAGMRRTIFDNRVANGALFSLDGSGTPSTFAYGGYLMDFKIMTTTSPATSRGIDFRANWFLTLERLWIEGLSSHAIRLTSNSADPDSSSYVTIKDVIAVLNGGWGFFATSSGTFVAPFYTFKNCAMNQNTLGGVRVAAGQHWRFEESSFSSNSGPGISVPFVSGLGAAQQFEVDSCEFDGDVDYGVDFANLASGKIVNSKWVITSGNPAVCVRLGDGSVGGGANNIYCGQNIIRRDAGSTTGFVIGTNGSYNRIEDTNFVTTVGVTKYADSGTQTLVREDGNYVRFGYSARQETIADSYTPDLSVAMYHRVIMTTTPFVVNDPIATGLNTGNPQNGWLLVLSMVASGVTVTPTFGADYDESLVPSIGPSETATACFIYEPSSEQWVQVGSWSILPAAASQVSDLAYGGSWDGVTTLAPSKNAVYDKIETIVNDTAYDASSWNAVTTIAPSKNAVRDKIETLTGGETNALVSDTAYNATSWNGVTTIAPSKNAVRDQFETLLGSSAYTPTNVTTDRSYDANATTTDELADVLGTLISDLQGKGILS